MNLELKYIPGNEIQLNGFGINFKIKPSQLLKNMFTAETQACLDEMLEAAFKTALTEFYHSNDYDNSKDEITTRQIVNEHVKKIAHLERLMGELHSDSECIELSSAQKSIREFCYSVWKYSIEYGYVPSKTVELENK